MKSILPIITLLLLTHVGFSQDSLTVSDSEKTKAIVNKLTRDLALSSNQQNQAEVIIKKRFTAIAKLRNQKTPIDRQSANQKAIDELKKIFSNDQFDLFIKLRQQNQAAREVFIRENPSYKFSEDDKDLDI
jgi:hypothetical protein